MRSVNTYGNRCEAAAGAPERRQGSGLRRRDPGRSRGPAHRRQSPRAVRRAPGDPERADGRPRFDNDWIKQNNGAGYDPNLAEAPDNRPFITIVRKRQGFPGFDTLFQTRGADAELGVNPDTGVDDDPAHYTFGPVVDYLWALRSKKGPDGGTGQTMIMGPWLPKQTIQELGTLQDRANPFRGILPPTRNGLAAIGAQVPRSPVRRAVDIGPPGNGGAPYPNASPTGDIVDPQVLAFFNDTTYGWNAPQARFPNFIAGLDGTQGRSFGFGGDFNGIIPCLTPSIFSNSTAQAQIKGTNHDPGCFPSQNVRAIGGVTELPARPAPDVGNLEKFDPKVAQGLYVPSSNLRRALLQQDFDNPDFNISEDDRAWNRGQSQQEWKEVKEAYVDVEMLDSRLWVRFGIQNIVWGKTELFRTTDQFNPQDLALSSLASLEESRIALMAGRFVYSLYDIGPLEDVRAEFAFNFDNFKPADLGACGEAFTPDLVCGITHGPLLPRPDRRRHRRRRSAAGPVGFAQGPRDRRPPRMALGPLQLRVDRFLGLQRLPVPGCDQLLRAQRGSPERPPAHRRRDGSLRDAGRLPRRLRRGGLGGGSEIVPRHAGRPRHGRRSRLPEARWRRGRREREPVGSGRLPSPCSRTTPIRSTTRCRCSTTCRAPRRRTRSRTSRRISRSSPSSAAAR